MICAYSYKKEHMIGLKCQHMFCMNCVRDNFKVKILEGDVATIPCMMAGDCQEEYTEEHVKEYSNEFILKKYKYFKNNILVNTNPNMRWCPAATCELVVER
jgi:hypothetical protein